MSHIGNKKKFCFSLFLYFYFHLLLRGWWFLSMPCVPVRAAHPASGEFKLPVSPRVWPPCLNHAFLGRFSALVVKAFYNLVFEIQMIQEIKRLGKSVTLSSGQWILYVYTDIHTYTRCAEKGVYLSFDLWHLVLRWRWLQVLGPSVGPILNQHRESRGRIYIKNLSPLTNKGLVRAERQSSANTVSIVRTHMSDQFYWSTPF